MVVGERRSCALRTCSASAGRPRGGGGRGGCGGRWWGSRGSLYASVTALSRGRHGAASCCAGRAAAETRGRCAKTKIRGGVSRETEESQGRIRSLRTTCSRDGGCKCSGGDCHARDGLARLGARVVCRSRAVAATPSAPYCQSAARACGRSTLGCRRRARPQHTCAVGASSVTQ